MKHLAIVIAMVAASKYKPNRRGDIFIGRPEEWDGKTFVIIPRVG